LTEERIHLAAAVRAACARTGVELYGSFQTGWFHFDGSTSFSDIDTRLTRYTEGRAGRAAAAVRSAVYRDTGVRLDVSVRRPETHRTPLPPPVSIVVAKVFMLLTLLRRRDRESIAYQCCKFALRVKYAEQYLSPPALDADSDRLYAEAAACKLGLAGVPDVSLTRESIVSLAPDIAPAVDTAQAGDPVVPTLRSMWPEWERVMASHGPGWLVDDVRKKVGLALSGARLPG
jgi:hypothetical protein